MGKHKPLSLDTHKYRTTFTSTTKIDLDLAGPFVVMTRIQSNNYPVAARVLKEIFQLSPQMLAPPLPFFHCGEQLGECVCKIKVRFTIVFWLTKTNVPLCFIVDGDELKIEVKLLMA
jgi:hypothetical protein